MSANGLLLAGDVGGTWARLALCDAQGVRFEQRYACREFGSFAALLERFRADAGPALGGVPRITRASFGVAGPVTGNRIRMTNLGWEIDGRDLGVAKVRLLNDFEASAHALDGLTEADLVTLQPGVPRMRAPRLVVGAGTGLGVAVVLGRGRSLRAIAGEGGHAGFAPMDERQEALLKHLRHDFRRVELEHVVSGAGLARIYGFLGNRGAGGAMPAADDAAAAISRAALEGNDPLALAALDLFIACYGAAAGDYALAVLARGGVYVTGGIAPRILARLRTGGFVAAFNAKGTFADAARACPLHIVTNERLGLLGAVAAAPR